MPSYLLFLNEGLERMSAGEKETARSLFEAASQMDPQDPLSYLGRGGTALTRGDVSAAAPFFRRVAQMEKAPAVAAYGLGLCYLFTGHAEPAGKYLREALQKDPQLTSASVYLALLAIVAGDYPQAQEYLQQAQAKDGDPEWLDFLQVLLHYHQGAWPEVITAVRNQLGREAEAKPGRSADLSLPSSPLLPLRMSFTEASELQLQWVPCSLLSEDLLQEPPAPRPPLSPPDRPSFQNLAPGQVVRGVQSLRVWLPSGVRPDFVIFSVDGQCISVTNNRPYVFRWDTTQETEGAHKLTIRTEGQGVLENHLEVIVQNREPEPEIGYDLTSCQRFTDSLSRMLQVAPPGYDGEQVLLHACLRNAQYQEALRLAEDLLGRNWKSQEVLPLLLKLYALTGRSQPLQAVYQPRAGVPGGHRVALTFDDGPNIPYTQEVLKILRAYDARATFLVVGRRAEQYAYLVREIHAQGHEIGNHSYSHRRMQTLPEEEVLLEILRTEGLIRQAGVSPVRFFRPPGGHSGPQVRAALARLGYTLLFWTINGGDFKHLLPAEAARRMVERATDGTIFLLHNGPDNTLELLPHLLQGLRARGFRCVTASEILRSPVPAEPFPAGSGR